MQAGAGILHLALIRHPRRQHHRKGDTMNDRRCTLIDKEIEGSILPTEERELEKLQRRMLAHRRRVAPLPITKARALYQYLLAIKTPVR